MLISNANFLRRPRSRGLVNLVIVSIAAILLTACAGTRGGPIPYDVQNFHAPDAPRVAAVETGYKIAPLDTLRVRVFQVADLSGEYQVDLAGNLALPLIGNVRAVGLTVEELQQRLVQSYGVRYLRHPDITVGISASSQQGVTVDGAVIHPGEIPFQSNLTLQRVVALAGGTNENSNPRRVAIFRQIDGQRMAAAFDLTMIRQGRAEDPQVYRGDIVVVDGSRVRSAWRDILQALPILAIFHPFGI